MSPPPITESELVLILLVVVVAAGWVSWLLGYDKGHRDGYERSERHLRRNLNLPPRVQR